MTKSEFFERYDFNIDTDHLGSGAFGDVYKAFDNVNNREVAIKSAPLKNGTKTLQDEFDAIKHLDDHVNIGNYENVRCIKMDTGIVEYAIMQYYPLGNGQQFIQTNISNTTKEQLADGVINGIKYLHKHNVFHRDLKWSNVLISQNPRTLEYIPKIADFGLSKRIGNSDKSWIENSIAGGTYSYLAPEHFKKYGDENKLKLNADLWSVGVMLYRLFVGELPFPILEDESNQNYAISSQSESIVNDPIPNKVNIVSEPYRTFIKKCLVKDPNIRDNDASSLFAIQSSKEITQNKKDLVLEIDEKTILVDKKEKNPSNDDDPIANNNQYLKVILLCIGILLAALGIWNMLQNTKPNEIQKPPTENVESETPSTPIISNEKDFLYTFVKDFNDALSSEAKFEVYNENKKLLDTYINSKTIVIENEMKSTLDGVIMKHINTGENLVITKTMTKNGNISTIIFQ